MPSNVSKIYHLEAIRKLEVGASRYILPVINNMHVTIFDVCLFIPLQMMLINCYE